MPYYSISPQIFHGIFTSEATRSDETMWRLKVRMPVAWRDAMGSMGSRTASWLGDEMRNEHRNRSAICWAFLDVMFDVMKIHCWPKGYILIWTNRYSSAGICARSPMGYTRLRLWSPHVLHCHASTAATTAVLQLPTGSITWQEWVLSKQTQTWSNMDVISICKLWHVSSGLDKHIFEVSLVKQFW